MPLKPAGYCGVTPQAVSSEEALDWATISVPTAMQDEGFDTLEANFVQGLPPTRATTGLGGRS